MYEVKTKVDYIELLLRVQNLYTNVNEENRRRLEESNAHYALQNVVALHKPRSDMNGYAACEYCSSIAYYNVPYPCRTMIEVAKEFNDYTQVTQGTRRVL